MAVGIVRSPSTQAAVRTIQRSSDIEGSRETGKLVSHISLMWRRKVLLFKWLMIVSLWRVELLELATRSLERVAHSVSGGM